MPQIRTAIVGVGNCASSLVQGIGFYQGKSPQESIGLAHPTLGGFGVSDIQIVAAFDIDRRKVGRPLNEALFALPNNTMIFQRELPRSDVIVQMGEVLDGVPPHMADFPIERRFEPDTRPSADVVKILRDSGAEVLVNYLPVGSQKATEFYVRACLEAGVGLVNCIPVFLASNPTWAKRFIDANLPCIGDDIKAQVGATVTHRTLAKLFSERGSRVERTYQLNTGGNTDFLNMLSRERLRDKKISKTDAVQTQLDVPLDPENIHIGPSDYVPFLKDKKICFLRIEGTGFGGAPIELELRLSVEDSPNSAGVAVDAIRCCKLARDKSLSGPILPVCAWTMKHPPQQMDERVARIALGELLGTS